MKSAAVILAAFAFLAGAASATERYTDARILEVESADDRITVFLTNVSGDNPPLGNGYTNLSPERPLLMIANSVADVSARRHLFAVALTAYTAGMVVRFRWEDAGANAGRVIAIISR
jgi:hypothetical protein